MFLEKVIDALQSSALAPLFVDLQSERVQSITEGNGRSKHVAALRIQNLFPTNDGEHDRFYLVETDRSFIFDIPKFATLRSVDGVVNVSLVNGIAWIGRLTWGVETGDIGIDWIVTKHGDSEPSLSEFETIIASMFLIYFQEKLWFLAASLDTQPAMVQAAMKPLFAAAEKQVREVIVPAITSVLG